MRKLLIADAMDESRLAVEALFRERCEVRTCTDGDAALEILRNWEADILVLDLMLPKTDGLSLLRELSGWEHRPMVLVQSSLDSPYIRERLRQLNVDYVLMKPYKLEAIEERLGDFLSCFQQTRPQKPSGEQLVVNILMHLGFSPKLDGYNYLTVAVPMYARDPSQSITKELYASVGKLWQKQASLVERSIRSAIEKAFREGDTEIWRLYFGAGPDGRTVRPTNGVFIARMAQLIARRDLQQEVV